MSESSILYVTILIITFVACNQDIEAPQHHRVRRFLQFQNISRILCRVNVKDNLIKVNQIFAHGYGFRANIDLLQPPKAHRFHSHHKVSRRDIYSTFEQLMIQQGIDGRSCVLKMLCDAYHKPEPAESGMFFNIFKIIFTHSHADDYEGVNIPELLRNGCSQLDQQCPLSMLELTPYTDII